LKQTVSILCVKTGSKYSQLDLERLQVMVERNCTLPFVIYCLTDNVDDLPAGFVGIKVDPKLDLEKYWWKLCLFNLGWNETVLYFDLDIIIQKNFDYVFDNIKENSIKCLDTSNVGAYYPYDGRKDNILIIPPVTINSSIMLFNPSFQQHLFDLFMKNPDFNMVKWWGVDRFIEHNSKDITFFDYCKDYYLRAKGVDKYDPRYTKTGLTHDPRKTFCIMNQCKPEHYIGLEKYFI
jgi:hypothetical protein